MTTTINSLKAEGYDAGYEDRCKGRPMRETFTLSRSDENAYINGFRDACEGFAQDRAAIGAEKNFGC